MRELVGILIEMVESSYWQSVRATKTLPMGPPFCGQANGFGRDCREGCVHRKMCESLDLAKTMASRLPKEGR